MYVHKPKVIWIDGTCCTLGFLTGFLAFVSHGFTYLYWDKPAGKLLLIPEITFILSALVLFYFAWRIGRRRKAAYDARPNKVLPRGSKTNADMLY